MIHETTEKNSLSKSKTIKSIFISSPFLFVPNVSVFSWVLFYVLVLFSLSFFWFSAEHEFEWFGVLCYGVVECRRPESTDVEWKFVCLCREEWKARRNEMLLLFVFILMENDNILLLNPFQSEKLVYSHWCGSRAHKEYQWKASIKKRGKYKKFSSRFKHSSSGGALCTYHCNNVPNKTSLKSIMNSKSI